MISIEIPLVAPSMNEFCFGSRFKYLKIRNKWYDAMATACADIPKCQPNVKAYVTVYAYRQRILDEANLIGGLKPLPDALKHLGLIHDDDPDHMKCHYFQVPCGKRVNQRTVVCIAYGLTK